jgi:excisionase family DNA binding protein
MDMLDKKSPEIISFFAELDKMLDSISQALKKRNSLRNNNRLLTGKEVCQLLRISPRTFQDWRDTGKIPFIRIGGKALYREREVIL